MANINRSALDALSFTNFPNNTSQLISPADLRDWLKDGIDSFVTQKDSSRLENVIYENEGSGLAAAASVDLASATGNYLHITGAFNGITSFGVVPAGGRFVLVFDGVCTLTDSATLILPGGSDITTAAGDCAMLVSEGSGNWRMVGFFPISGGGGGGDITAVTAGTGLSGGGTSGAVTLNLANTAVTPNSYTNANITVDQQGRITAASSGTAGGVTSFDAGSTGLTPTGATTGAITLGGTLAIANGGTGATTQQTALNALASTTTSGQYLRGNGTNVQMSAIQAGDVPTLNQNTTGTASNVTGVVAIANGGTGQTTQQLALNALAATTASGQYLRGNGTNVVMSAIQAGDVPTLNQNTTGTASNVTGTVAIANGGTGQTTQQLALNALAGSTTSGQYLRGNGTNIQMSAIQAADVPTLNQNTTGTASNVTGVVAIANGGTGQTTANAAINALLPSQTSNSGRYLTTDGTNTSWGSPTGSGTVASGTNNRLAYYTAATTVSSANTGAGIGIDPGNNRIGIGFSNPIARLDLAAPTGTSPSILLTPSTGATISGTTNGSIWCDTASSNTCLTMRKDSAYTKIITLDRNPDLAVGSGSGVVLADSAGTLSKGADLTALGIYAQTDQKAATTNADVSLIGTVTGVTTLPANFFGVGKTITIFVSGLYSQANSSQTCTISLKIGATTLTNTLSFTHSSLLTDVYWEAAFVLTCRTAGAAGVIAYQGKGLVNHATNPLFSFMPAATVSSINTTGTLAIDVVARWSNTGVNSIRSDIHYANYIN